MLALTRMLGVAAVVGLLAAQGATAAIPDSAEVLARECATGPATTVWPPGSIDRPRAATLCMIKRLRARHHLSTTGDPRLSRASRTGLDRAVTLNFATATDPIGNVTAVIDRGIADRCRRPPRVHWVANDSGPNGTIHTPFELAKWVIHTASAPPEDPALTRLDAKGVLIAVVARSGRVGEATATGSTAVMITGFRCH